MLSDWKLPLTVLMQICLHSRWNLIGVKCFDVEKSLVTFIDQSLLSLSYTSSIFPVLLTFFSDFFFSLNFFLVSSPVDLLIMQALCWVHDDLNQVDISSYVLKVCGQEEVLQK